jgi:ribose transport system permease protein
VEYHISLPFAGRGFGRVRRRGGGWGSFRVREAVMGNARKNLVSAGVLVAALAAALALFHVVSGGKFLASENFTVVVSHIVYPAFTAWGLSFLFACGYTDMSVGGVVVLSAFASMIFGSMFGYPGVILAGLLVGVLLIFVNFSIFAFTRIPSWIASISLAMVYEAFGFYLKTNRATNPLVTKALDRNYRVLGQLPWSAILLVAGFIVAYVVYNRTTIGLNIRAIGGNKGVSAGMGVNVNRTLMWVGLIAGAFIGSAAVVQISYSGLITVKTGLTSMTMIFQPLAIVLLAQIMQKRINIIVAIPICSFIIYSIFNLLTILHVPSGTLQEACLGAFLIFFGVIGQRGNKGVVK